MGTTSDKGSKTKKATLNENIIVDENLNQVLKSICKISIHNGESNIIGTGFFIKIFITDIPYNYLMTNAHLITDEIVDSQKEIEIYYDYETKKNSIILNNEEREINEYNTNNLDIAIIQILDSDNIDDNYFLLPNLDYKNLEDKKIFVPHFPKGNNLYSEGEITKVEKNEFVFDTNKIQSSLGCPILL